ncbi:MAG: ribose-phosphate pyrophosphokinase [Candidatus Infernicultor aquiphilus]|uniref:Ribose-phosphate pyrophosphokinase n=1 Tax=Candidatus Infernicultor aquiphilus TaxID=1805029 RepID=A0A1J5GU67_9BACT|nr:ribose-phosphate pyrophosphokinase [bacterium]OIP72151.1 MAG: ribose-phosphate pyrophosphokinase [Candidatus Atribacteria bacterium CG2_30_33_13]PIU24991.1 MAG: ribose-phosphate pyrophosphokinase [Candidatus Atribacteria bacterium CG08_land_8_20_14_0_20_33_29]PIW11729.1 MAG: ribose-phosphate pyrophosphokinase [Candidatus Atribacteria bacterium CG17_big_fil_post_rev_8_21_14_2_50_34_11]PIX33563.1 MAG: ribose-phosphate pyrophosphokinase [Candidatus Atribacteria bacterium CG_4_8_14_3_um_filter_3
MLSYDQRTLKIFAGNSNKNLAEEIGRYLNMSLGQADVSRFPDGEIKVKIEESVRGEDVFIIQSTCPPANEYLMELLIMIDALRRASAGRITAVIPYYGYARQERKTKPREPITAKLVANLLVSAGSNRVITMDLHAGQIQGFFDIPVDQLEGVTILSNYIKEKNLDKVVVVSPDVGGTARAREFSGRLAKPIAIIDKYRSAFDEVEIMHIVGEVKDKTAIIVDDLIDTAASIIRGTQALLNAGAKEVYVCATHAVFAGPAKERIEKSLHDGLFKEVVVTNTIPIDHNKSIPGIKILSVAEIFAEAINRIHNNLSVSTLFN